MDADRDEERGRGYLLGRLSAEERENLEEEFFRDDDLFDRLGAIEADLIDDYVSGALSAEERARFQTHFLTSPDRRRKVDVARALQEAVIVDDPAPRSSWWSLRFNWPAWQALAAAAAAVVLMAASLVVIWERLLPQATQPIQTVAFQDTSGPATLATDRTIVLAALGPLPPALSDHVKELVATGIATPTPAAGGAMAALRQDLSRRGSEAGQDPLKPRPVPLGPMLTGIRSSRPTLRWAGVPGARDYIVQVGDQDGKTLWQGPATTQTEITLPPETLQRGRVYFWQVEARGDGGSSAAPAVGFWLVDDGTLRDVEAIERNYQASALALAATFVAHGLYEEALTQVERLAKLNPGNTEIQNMLSRLRSQLSRR